MTTMRHVVHVTERGVHTVSRGGELGSGEGGTASRFFEGPVRSVIDAARCILREAVRPCSYPGADPVMEGEPLADVVVGTRFVLCRHHVCRQPMGTQRARTPLRGPRGTGVVPRNDK